jgi:hypothetical protein
MKLNDNDLNMPVLLQQQTYDTKSYFLRSICTWVFEFLRYVQKLDITSNTSGHIDDMSRYHGPIVQKYTTCPIRTNYMYIHKKSYVYIQKWYVYI